jgi:hypothetical protein
VGVTTREIVVPNPPPPPSPTPDLTPPAQPEDADATDDDPDVDDRVTGTATLHRLVVLGATSIGVPIGLAAIPAAVVVVAKHRRTLRRRRGSPAARIEGAWSEVVDRFTPDGNLPDLDQLASSVDSLLRQRPGG